MIKTLQWPQDFLQSYLVQARKYFGDFFPQIYTNLFIIPIPTTYTFYANSSQKIKFIT